MELSFLGPITIRSDITELPLSGDRNRSLLAALLLDANRPVPMDRFIDVLWGEQPPRTARQQVQNRLGKLRSLLGQTRAPQISRVGGGYALEVGEHQVDGLRFRELCAQAEHAHQLGQLDRAAGYLHTALGLWRGTALQGIDSPALRCDAVRWEESRLKAIETLVELEFSRGRHGAITADLHTWLRGYPYHEGLHCRLAEALHLGSRTGEAIMLLHQLKMRLAGELGISPGAAVQEMHLRLVGASTEPDTPRQSKQAVEALRRALTETTQSLMVLSSALELLSK
ncbi:AfsR/SARP family transcriptional regulator [Micromonospora sp. D93]|uniref:AfsR/SARP family transcriptional regulator n=1 Tax=Micromonospora sp. D93 TaxID=2824886 RepID=UPI001B3831B0|nr:AfsR/SARP family transcriptional regulator [Micromonospora sp. D93]MBQ1018858.1 AfsR/SARP family transcriptional regulator [Micromonospora sp. D93]